MIKVVEATTAALFVYAEDIIDEEELLSVVHSETENYSIVSLLDK